MHFIPAVEDAPGLASEVNVGGTRALLEALEPTPPDVFLFASTAAVYPDRLGPIDESCAPGPIDLYGRTKLEGERLVTEFAKASGTRCVVVRLFNVVGRRETNPHVVPDLVGQLRRNAAPVRLGNLEAKRDYTDVLDVAKALERLLSARLDGLNTFNLGSGRSVSVADLVHVCERILGRPIDVETENRRLRAQDRAELLADPGLLRAATGWEPMRSLQETIADLLTEPEPA
jgi:UDP-glucose 4-epimerase